MPDFHKILIANRGEIACRVLRSVHALGYRSVAVYSSADADARHVQLADEAVCIGPAAVQQSYLCIETILAAARQTGADAVHPGYGFLSENAAFARACEQAGIVFIGPSAEAIELMGSKRLAKLAMLEAGVPCIPGYEGTAQDDATLSQEAERIGYPLMVKASAGGGGRGMRLVQAPGDLRAQLRTARSEAQNAFGSGELILERALIQPRHVEIQVFGDHHGNLVHLGERDCSVQRRHQKVVEESPCPLMTAELRQAMGQAAIRAAATVDYVGAGTVEFLLDASGAFYFLEMNTRLQVEHPVTELVTGQDLVAWQIRVAAGEPLPLKQEQVRLQGHAMEVRLYAEDPARGFLPQTGRVLRWEPAQLEGVRFDHGLLEGQAVSPFYDPMLAKIVAHGATRDEARRRLLRAVEDCVLLGVSGNQRFLASLLRHPQFAAGQATTAFIGEHFADDPSLQPQLPTTAELACTAALLLQASAQAYGQPSGRCGWSNAASVPSRFQLKHEEQTYAVELHVLEAGAQPRFEARVGDERLALRLLACDGRWASLELDGIRQRLAYHLQDGRLWLHGRGGSLELLDIGQQPVGSAAAVGCATVKAPMDGAIVEVLVNEGERVAKGTLLLVLEAMKMEHPLRATIDGVIARIPVRQGDQVKNRQLLVELDALSD
ncbi:acetyl/propionyl/methylcrotonyl-CoA carboxylase subunit alpha [Pseudomonas benzenivorans]|uniref:Acetyl/propionyl/methylcrotonyl-CoA carboxylase subunit alpha n=1 Tax=Pseudomonas benzenivorans TaxID=556533 RepID=A0ABY5H7P9_9PSED|nr:acetyl/propionyl/methylcrotonyl-CoA carboxylase subunit alpha [Pseudomonas benzenivorans]UTW08353.1 acetyl/propionyl/methylcrotonyl-CoA carboxylase subunit alpha [Pseudomonas benzenivorans]